MQLELFSPEIHEHVYEEFQGPHVVNPVIESTYRGGKWCWTCASWIDPTNKEMAEFFARDIKRGNSTRKDAIDIYCYWGKTSFYEATLAIDIAIGDINSGMVDR